MKKKTPKKLVLAKETVRSLEEAWLSKEVRGGTYTVTACYSHCNSACAYCVDEPMY